MTVSKHSNQENIQKNTFNWAYTFTGLTFAVGNISMETGTSENSHLDLEEGDKEYTGNDSVF